MASAVARAEILRSERAFLALLLLVGAGSIGVGAFDLIRDNASSLPALLDLTLGSSVLLVTWLFLAPSAYPTFFGDPPRGEPPVARPYLTPVQPPAVLPVLPMAPREPPKPTIPKWADPLVGGPVPVPPRAVPLAAADPGAAPAPPEPRGVP